MSDPTDLVPDPAPAPAPVPVKPGWQSSETWVTALVQVLGALGAMGIITAPQAALFGDWISRFVAAAMVLTALVVQAIHYVHSRTSLKAQQMDPSKLRVPVWLVAAFCLFLVAPAHAQDRPAPMRKAGVQVGLFNFGRSCQPQQQQQQAPQYLPAPQQQSDPAIAAALNRIADQHVLLNAQVAALLALRQGTPAPAAPAPAAPIATPPLVYMLAPQQGPSPPQQVLPIVGAPQQVLPIQGAPQQLLPIAGAPQQQLPIQGQPQQQIQIYGAPQQQLLPGGAAPQQFLAPQPPAPVQPVQPALPPIQQRLMPTAPTTLPPAPTWQRYVQR